MGIAALVRLEILASRLFTHYCGFLIYFEPEPLPDARYRARLSVVDLDEVHAPERPIEVAVDSFDTAPAAGEFALTQALQWIEARRNLVVARDSFVAIPWFSASAFGQLRSSMADGVHLGADHAAWLGASLTAERAARESGYIPVRVAIEPGPFLAWCVGEQASPDMAARQRYAQQQLERLPL